MEIPGKRLLAGALAALIAAVAVGGITTGADALEFIMAGAAAVQVGTVTETYASPRHGNETGLGTVWLYEAEKIQSSQSLTSGQYIAMTKDANGNFDCTIKSSETIRLSVSGRPSSVTTSPSVTLLMGVEQARHALPFSSTRQAPQAA